MASQQIEVFISYRWTEPSVTIADEIQHILTSGPQPFRILRDNTEVGYKGDLKAYMERLGTGSFVVIIVSDGYLKSHNCMFELITLAAQPNFLDRIYPIVLEDAKGIYVPEKRLEYVHYWEERKQTLKNAFSKLDDFSHIEGSASDASLYNDIRDAINGITTTLSKLNTLSLEAHRKCNFEEIALAILEQAKKAEAAKQQFHRETHPNNLPCLSPNFQFACDRAQQMAIFEKGRKLINQPPRFFFLHGEETQSHLGFAKRIKMQMEGEFLQGGKRDLRCSLHQIHYPEAVEKEYDIEQLLTLLHDQYGLNADERTPLLAQRFGRMLRESKTTSPFRNKDLVLLVFLVNDYDLKAPDTPAVIDWINREFFSASAFDADAPEVIVLWGLIYNSRSGREKVFEILNRVAHSCPDWRLLPELGSVKVADIDRWLQQNAVKLSSKARDQILEQYFAWQPHLDMDEVKLDMEDVEAKLAMLIEAYNEGKLNPT